MTRTGTATDVPHMPSSMVTPVAADVAMRVASSIGRDADSLLLALLRIGPQMGLSITSSQGQQWWLQMSSATVLGTPLSTGVDTGGEALFMMRAQIEAPPDAGRPMPMDQWVYWVARHTRGDDLYGYSDNHVISVRRGVASATHGRDFARLMVAYSTPMTVREAAARTRTDVDSVRRFLNASTVLQRVQVHGAAPALPLGVTLRTDAPAPAPSPAARVASPHAGTAAPTAVPRGLFGRLLDRLRGRP